MGANSGIAGVHNLVWKLGLVLARKAPPSLIKSYTTERHPLTYSAAEESSDTADELGLRKIEMPAIQARFPRMMGFGVQIDSLVSLFIPLCYRFFI